MGRETAVFYFRFAMANCGMENGRFLLRYLRGRAILVGLPLLLLITLLPVWMGAGAAADLWVGPAERLIPGTEQWEWYLPCTGRSLGLIE